MDTQITVIVWAAWSKTWIVTGLVNKETYSIEIMTINNELPSHEELINKLEQEWFLNHFE